MNQNVSKYIYLFITICVVIIVAKLFISILPWLLIAIAVIYCVNKIKKYIDTKANKKKSNLNNKKDVYDNFDNQYDTGEVIDVDYEDIEKK